LELLLKKAYPVNFHTKWVTRNNQDSRREEKTNPFNPRKDLRRNPPRKPTIQNPQPKDTPNLRKRKSEFVEDKRAKVKEDPENKCSHCDGFHNVKDCWYKYPNLATEGFIKKHMATLHELHPKDPRFKPERVDLKMNVEQVGKKKKSNQFQKINRDRLKYLRFYSPIVIQNHPLIGLIDSGATKCFISKSVVAQLKLQPSTELFEIHLLNEKKIKVPKVNVQFTIKGKQQTHEAYVIEMECENVIIGTNLFQDLGITISVNFNMLKEYNEHIIDITPSEIGITQIPQNEHQLLMESISDYIIANLKTQSEFLRKTHLERDLVSLPIPKVKSKWIKQYKIADNIKPIITQQVKEWLQDGIIETADKRVQHNTPLVVSRKSDGGYRVCLDFRYINSILQDNGNTGAMPDINSIFNAIQEAKPKYFSVIDIKSAYHKMMLDPDSRWLSKFQWENEHFQFIGCPFGIRSFPAIFSEIMHLIMEPFESFSRNYLDDIIIYSSTFEEHQKHIKQVLEALTEHNLTISTKKCKFGYSSVKLLGHIISCSGISMDKNCLKQLEEYDRPTSGKQVERFLGFINFYRRYFITEPIVAPLNKLRKTRKFDWTKELEDVYMDIIDCFKKSPVLHLPDYTYPIKIGIDASRSGLGLICYQDIPMKRKRVKGDTEDLLEKNYELVQGTTGNSLNSFNDKSGLVDNNQSFEDDCIDPKNNPSDEKATSFLPNLQDRPDVQVGFDDITTREGEFLPEGGKLTSDKPNLDNVSNVGIKSVLEPPLDLKRKFKSKKHLGFTLEQPKANLKRKLDDVDTYERKAIYFNSRSLKPHESRYGITKLEALGLVWALKSCDQYIRGNSNVEIFTDHKALESIFNQTSPT
jgi:hypothetical protein